MREKEYRTDYKIMSPVVFNIENMKRGLPSLIFPRDRRPEVHHVIDGAKHRF